MNGSRLIQLGAELERAWSEQRSSKSELAYERSAAVVRKIEATRARTLDELRVKARAIAWCHGGEQPISLARSPTRDVRLAQSIVADLLQ